MKKVLEIPVDAILDVGDTKKLAGQGVIRPVHKIDFTNRLGKKDAIAIGVKELSQWKKVIGSMIGKT